MIHTDRLARRSKEELANEIARFLNIDEPAVSNGSSVRSDFVSTVYEALFSTPAPGTDVYRQTENLIARLDVASPYDPWWDTSERHGASGGGTVTTRAYSRILAALTSTPRCFLLPASLDPGYSGRITFNRDPRQDPLAEAGPGSLVFYGSTAPNGWTMTHQGVVIAVTPEWRAPWVVEIDVVPLTRTVQIAAEFDVVRPSEIAYAPFTEVLRASSTPTLSMAAAAMSTSTASTASRLAEAYPVDSLDLRPLRLPPREEAPIVAALPGDRVDSSSVDRGGREPSRDDDLKGRRYFGESGTNKITEERAVAIAMRCLESSGWTLVRDCQADGIGYDLLYSKLAERLKVEVKGIQGSRPTFNVTPKEWAVALSDPDWVLIAITNVLSPVGPTVHVFSRGDIAKADRRITGYRLSM